MIVERNWHVMFKTVLEQGFTLLLYSVTTFLQLLGLQFIFAEDAYYMRVGRQGTQLSLSSPVNASEEDVLPPLPSDMVVSDIENFDQGACWSISFIDGVHCKNINNFMLILKEDSYHSRASKHVCKDVILKNDNLMQTGETFDHLLQNGVYEHLVTGSLCYSSKNDTDHATEADYEDDEANDSDDVEASDSDLDYVSSDLDDSDDLEVVFDDNVEVSDWSKGAEFTPFLQSADLLDICDSLDGTHCLYQENIFPCVTNVRMANMIHISDRSEPVDCLNNPLRHTWDQFATSYNLSKDLSEPSKLKDLKQKTNKKKVSFAVQDCLVTVHPMVKWDFAYRSARKGPWERYACDRFHFQQRIRSCEQVLGPMLERKYHNYRNSIGH